ncbi:hypothetical protein LIER_28441 [Lithospermum erythrorhizon]|uniref:Uncharacterized protein n=1 Tax=Lithospermum erythrorhizon TaxID=34254 RepID=A0AAV3RJV0_LITER
MKDYGEEQMKIEGISNCCFISSYVEPTAAPGIARRATGTTGSTTTHCWGAMTINKGLFDLPLALTWISCICRERQLVVIGITTWVVRTSISSDLSSMGIML